VTKSEVGTGEPLHRREPLAAEIAEINRARGRVMLPLMVVVHAIHIAVFRTAGEARASLDPHIVRWRDAIALAHAVTLALALTLGIVALRARRGQAWPLLGPATALLYLLHGAIVAAIDQLTITSVTPFVAYALGIAVVVALTPRMAIAIYTLALATFVAGMLAMQPSPTVRLAMLPNGASIVAVSIALAWLLHASRRRDVVQRAIIDQQREALAQLNADLERRIASQVSEIVTRAEEVERLNTQLQAQVRARSTELSLALAKLARQDGAGGALRRGLVLGDRFEIDSLLGEGGMGAVYSGLDRSTGERVAVKVVQAGSAQELDALHRFLREAASAATVTHPAVVRMLHVDVSEDGMLFQVQELVDGVTLQARLRSDRRWEPSIVARFASVLCDALAAAHARGVVHRDVKPGNIMLTRAPPGLKLLDFGIAKLYEDALAGDAGTRTGAILGTPAFMAPEQVDGSRHVTDRADVYSVGVILFLLLTGKYPFDEGTPRRILLSHVLTAAPDARSLEPSVPAALAEIVTRCLQKEASARPAAEELARALATFADAHGAGPLDALERESAVHEVRAAENDLPSTVVAVKQRAAHE
jgi:hypothetical protein